MERKRSKNEISKPGEPNEIDGTYKITRGGREKVVSTTPNADYETGDNTPVVVIKPKETPKDEK